MQKLKVVASAMALTVSSATWAAGCGSTDSKNTVPGEGGAAGEGADAMGGQLFTPAGGGGEGGQALTPPGGEGGTTAGAGGDATDAAGAGGAGGESGEEACVPGESCSSNPGAPCLLGTTECREGVSDCVDDDAAMDGIACDAGTCSGGLCIGPFRLFNTGVDETGTPLEGGSVDPHYTLIQSAEISLPGPDAVVTSQIAEGYWVPQSETSKWLAPSANQSFPGATPCNAAGTYVYRTTFDLTGYDPTSLTITGQWGADNSGVDVRLNGVSLGITAGGYAPLTAFTISTGFLGGENTLDFEVADIGCPNGLRVELQASDVVLAATP